MQQLKLKTHSMDCGARSGAGAIGQIAVRVGAAVSLATSISFSAAAQEEENPYTVEVEAGVRYDDNITVDDSDRNSRQGDFAWLLRGSLGADFHKSKKSEISARYSFSQSLHDDLRDFDLQIHGLSFKAKTKVGKVNVAADYRYNFIKLGREDFLEIHSIRPNIGFLAAKKTYVTASYEYRELTFDELSLADRNAHRHSGAGKVYYLFGKGRNVAFGYKISRHRAQVDDLSYWGHTADASLKLPVTFGETKATYRLRYQYRHKDYSGIDTDIGAERRDRRHMFRTSLKVPFGERFYGEMEYRYIVSNSNLASIDYTNNVVSFSLGWSF